MTTLYKKTISKNGRAKYIPISEYSDEYNNSYPEGAHLVVCRPGVTSRKYNVDPAFAPAIAAFTYAKDAMAATMHERSLVDTTTDKITPEQAEAYNNLKQVFGERLYYLQWPSSYAIVDAGAEALKQEVYDLLENPAVKQSYDNFMLLCKLTYEEKNNG